MRIQDVKAGHLTQLADYTRKLYRTPELRKDSAGRQIIDRMSGLERRDAGIQPTSQAHVADEVQQFVPSALIVEMQFQIVQVSPADDLEFGQSHRGGHPVQLLVGNRVLDDDDRVVHIPALDQVVGEQVLDFVEENEGPADTDLVCIILSRLPRGGLDTQNAGGEIHRNLIGRLVGRFDPDPGSGLFVMDLNGLAQSQILALRILLHKGITPEGFDIIAGAAVQDRDLDVVDVNDGIVDSHARQGGQDMLYRIHIPARAGETGAAGRRGNPIRTGGNPGVLTLIDPSETDAGIGRCRMNGHPGNPAGMQAFPFESV